MKAYKCDICGKFYDGNVQEYEKIDPIAMSGIGFAPTQIAFFGENGTMKTATHDVCNNCLIKFKKLTNEIREGIR